MKQLGILSALLLIAILLVLPPETTGAAAVQSPPAQAVMTALSGEQSVQPGSYLRGDADLNGSVTLDDVIFTLVFNNYIMMEMEDQITALQYLCADADRNGAVDLNDAILIMLYYNCHDNLDMDVTWDALLTQPAVTTTAAQTTTQTTMQTTSQTTTQPTTRPVTQTTTAGTAASGLVTQYTQTTVLSYAGTVTDKKHQPAQNADYDLVVQKLSQFENTIDFGHPVTFDSVSAINDRLRTEHPEIFWVGTISLSGYAGSYRSATYLLDDGYTKQQIISMTQELERRSREIIEQIPAGASNFDKVVFVHDYLVANTVYDNAGAASGKGGTFSNAYGCLVKGSATCAGFSQGFQLLMRRLGFESGVVWGSAFGGSHAWNYVWLDGSYYWIDVTGDNYDGDTEKTGSIAHYYCLFPDSYFSRSHTPGTECFYVPVCTSLDRNYYVMQNAYYTGYDKDAVYAQITKEHQSGNVEMLFSDKAALNAAYDALWNGDIWSVPGVDYDLWQPPAFSCDRSNQYTLSLTFTRK